MKKVLFAVLFFISVTAYAKWPSKVMHMAIYFNNTHAWYVIVVGASRNIHNDFQNVPLSIMYNADIVYDLDRRLMVIDRLPRPNDTLPRATMLLLNNKQLTSVQHILLMQHLGE